MPQFCRLLINPRLPGWLSAMLAASVSGGQLNWSLPFTDAHRQSDGITQIPAGTVFQLGVFEGAFVPDGGNQAEWATYWRAADFEKLQEISGYVGLGGAYRPEAAPAPFTAGKQMYVWGFHLNADGSSQQWLGTDATWQVPSDDPLEFPVDIDIDDVATLWLGSANAATGTIQMEAVAAGAPLPMIYGDAWRSHYFTMAEIADPGIGGWQADPDADGLGNALEFAMGFDPLVPRSKESMTIHAQSGNLLLTCPGWKAAAVNVGIEESTTLQAPWLSLDTPPAFNPAFSRWELGVPATNQRNFYRMAVVIADLP